MAKPIDLFINLRVFFYKSVGRGNVGFWLVVIEVANKIVDGILWKIRPKFGIELSSKGFIVGDDEGGLAGFLYKVSHSEGFTGACNSEENLFFLARI
mgnify:CR=1 FL=1